MALIFDGISFLLKAISDNLDLVTRILTISRNQLNEDVYCFGLRNSFRQTMSTYSLLQVLRQTRLEGLTGNLSFDMNGLRNDYIIHLYKISLRTPLKKIGAYSSASDQLSVIEKRVILEENKTKNVMRKLIVVSILDEPFFMHRPRNREVLSHELTENDLYMGYCVDLTKQLSKMLNFTYELRIVKDGKYGSKSMVNPVRVKVLLI